MWRLPLPSQDLLPPLDARLASIHPLFRFQRGALKQGPNVLLPPHSPPRPSAAVGVKLGASLALPHPAPLPPAP